MWPFTLLVLLSVAHCFINVLSCVLCLPLPRRSGAGGSQTFRKSRSYRMEMHDSSKHTEVMHARGASVNRPCAYLCLLVFWCHYFVYAHVFFSALECSLLLYALVFYCMLVGSVGCQILKPPPLEFANREIKIIIVADILIFCNVKHANYVCIVEAKTV